MAVQDLERIEAKLDKTVAGAVAISDSVGGVLFTSMAEVMEFAKLLSLAGTAVPKHLRGNPGGCLAVTIQALEWRMSPVAVANKSYEVNDRIAYEAQLIHAVIEARAPLKGRLRGTYTGEGVERSCTVTGHMKGELEPLEYTSPTIAKIKVKNSPLWTADPDQQLWYYATRSWARRYCPDVLLGIYGEDELRDSENIKDITPETTGLKNRLSKKAGARGFDGGNVDRALEHKPETALNTAVSEGESKSEVAAANAPAEEKQLELTAGDVETELAGKRKALENCTSEGDVIVIADEVTRFLKANNRPDLLPGFLSLAQARGKKLQGKAAA